MSEEVAVPVRGWLADDEQLFSIAELVAHLPLSRRTFDTLHAEGRGPKPTYLSPRRVAFRARDIRDWLDSRPDSPQEGAMNGERPPTREQRRAAQLVGKSFLASMLRKDYAEADKAIPVTAENVVALELGGVLVRLLESDQPEVLVAELRARLANPPTD